MGLDAGWSLAGARYSRGKHMAQQGKYSNEGSEHISTSHPLAGLAEQSQLDFEIDFFGLILERKPDYVDVLRVMGNNLTLKGRYSQGLVIDKRLVQLRPKDPLAHYNLACSYALLNRGDQALKTLRQAVELGYRDFRYMREDRDLDSIRHDPRFRQLLREYENC
jgi:tetratricopeptide (TPR) repeat protein